MDLFGHRGQIWPDQNFFGPICGRHRNSGRNEVWNTSETQKLTEIWIKTFFSKMLPKIKNFGGLVCSRSSWELNFEFLSVPSASWLSVLPTKPARKVWDHSEIFLGGVVQILWKASILLDVGNWNKINEIKLLNSYCWVLNFHLNWPDNLNSCSISF